MIVPTLARKSLEARLGRNTFIGLAILAGVSFVCGSFILADSLRATFDDLVEGLTANVDLEVRTLLTVEEIDSVRDPVPADLVADVAAIPGVEVAEGTFARVVQPLDPDGDPVRSNGPPAFAVSWDPANLLSNVEVKEGRAPSGIDEVALDKATADRVGYDVGDEMTIVLGSGQRSFDVVGLIGLPDSDGFAGATITAFDPTSAAVLLDGDGEFDAIDIRLADGVDAGAVQSAIHDVLPDRVEVVTGEQLAEEQKDQIGEFVDIFGQGLLIFAVVTAFVAAFVINNVFGITIGQRLRELALLRAVGANARQVRRLVVIEAFAVAIVATALGVGGGFLVAQGIIQAFNAAGGGFPPAAMVLQPRTIVAGFVVGVGITTLSVLVPAIRASRIPPVAAMRPEMGFAAIGGGRRIVAGVVLTALGVAAFLVGIFVRPGGGQGLALFGGGGAMLTFLGVASLSSTVASPVSRLLGAPIERLFGTAGKFSRDNAARSPRRTARTASALMIGISLISAAAVFASSLRDTFGRILERAITADYIVWNEESPQQQLPPEVAERLAALPELSAVSPFRSISGAVGDATVDLTAVNPVGFPSLVDLDLSAGGYDSLADDGLMLFRDTAEARGLGVGDPVEVAWQNGVTSTLTVSGLFDDNSLDAEWLISIATLESVSTQTPYDRFVLAKIADGVDFEIAADAIRGAIDEYPQASPQTDAQFRETQEGQINQLLFLIAVLLVVAIIFSFIGIAITLALSVFERTREIGLLRAVGMNRTQLRRSVRWEAVIVALFGTMVGIAVGLLFGVSLSYAVPDNVIDGITIPIGGLIFTVVLAVVAAIIAALYPAIKASNMNVLEAITTE